MRPGHKYIVQSKKINISIQPFFVEHAILSIESGEVVKDIKFGKEGNMDGLFMWTYKITVENKSANIISLHNSNVFTINETGFLTKIELSKDIFNNKNSIKPYTTSEHHDMIILRSRSGVMCGEFAFKTANKSEDLLIKLPSVSLDSGDSIKMAC